MLSIAVRVSVVVWNMVVVLVKCACEVVLSIKHEVSVVNRSAVVPDIKVVFGCLSSETWLFNRKYFCRCVISETWHCRCHYVLGCTVRGIPGILVEISCDVVLSVKHEFFSPWLLSSGKNILTLQLFFKKFTFLYKFYSWVDYLFNVIIHIVSLNSTCKTLLEISYKTYIPKTFDVNCEIQPNIDSWKQIQISTGFKSWR